MPKQTVQSVFQNSLRTLVQVNTNFRKPEQSLSEPFQFTSYSLLLTSLRMSGTYFPKYRTGKKYSEYLINIICLIVLSLLTLRYGFRVGMSHITFYLILDNQNFLVHINLHKNNLNLYKLLNNQIVINEKMIDCTA